jgi:predicted metalloprotease with PDZ domain
MHLRACTTALLIALAANASRAEVPAPVDTPYPGTIGISVDATDLAQRIIRVRQVVPVHAGPLILLLPQWLPGHHSPGGPIDKIAGLVITANGHRLEWKRDPLNVYAFHVDVPRGIGSITTEYQYLTPTDRDQGRVVMTPNMLDLQWNALVLYPAGHYASRIDYAPSVTYPTGWQAGTALDVDRRDGDTVNYKPVPLDILVDSPVYAGRWFRQYDLAPGAKVPVHLDVVADTAKQLEAKPAHLAEHIELVKQATALFGSQHYDHYDFLFSLSEQMGGNGLEHQRSSEDGTGADYFSEWDSKTGSTDLLAHEFVHSWNGKFRRPADLWTPNFNVPMQDSLLWVYEGQTQYWGNVLAARSGLRPLDASRDAFAFIAARYQDGRPGLAWRNIQDTTNDPIVAERRAKPYLSYQLGEDYYNAGMMIWLEVDARIRTRSGGTKSLDDFAHAFFGVDDGIWRKQDTYTFDDIVAALNAVEPDDWAAFLRARLDGETAVDDGLEASGWRVVYTDDPGPLAKARAKEDKSGTQDFMYSIGLSVDKNGKITEVRWDSPAFNAGVGTGMTLVAIDDLEPGKDTLSDAIKAAKTDKAPIRLLVKDFDHFRTIAVDYHDGLRYPHLQRIDDKPDLLSQILAPRK